MSCKKVGFLPQTREAEGTAMSTEVDEVYRTEWAEVHEGEVFPCRATVRGQGGIEPHPLTAQPLLR